MKKTLSYAMIFLCLSFSIQAQQSTTGPIPSPGIDRGKINLTEAGQVVISGVPSYIWQHGCGPTAVGMVVGYYDTHGYPDLIPGDASTQTTAVDDAIANTPHYNDYSEPIDTYPNLLADKSETGGAHTSNCIGDFMQTSWSSRGNYYGWSWLSDIRPSFTNYVQFQNSNYNTFTTTHYNYDSDFWNSYKNEIDNNRPVVFLVDTDGDGSTDHFVTGIGYDETNMEYAIYDTWDNNIHWFSWQMISNGNQWGIYSFSVLQIISYTINVSVNPPGAGTVSGGGTYNNGDFINLIATVNSGYNFDNWSENGNIVSLSPDYSFFPHGNRNLIANFYLENILGINCKVFLQGSYDNASMMDTNLNSIIPGPQPFGCDPWNYFGTESIADPPDDMVDWILIELRDAVDHEMIVSRRAGLLMKNGDVADLNGSPPLNFSNVPAGDYYLCVFHRNHMPVMSAAPYPFPNATSYDFSDTLNFPPLGGGSKALIELEPGIFGMIAGDVNKDGVLKYSGPSNDRGPVLQHIVNQSGSTSITTTVTGYRDEDINTDKIIKYSGPQNDPSLIIQNLVGLTNSPSITGVYNSLVPEGKPPFECGDTLTDVRNGERYNTVMIGVQCWMAENLNIGNRINGAIEQSDNGIIEKYCYDDLDANCITYGGLYQWDEVMQYDTNNIHGICLSGWHLPTDEDWKILEGNVDSQYGIGNPIWDTDQWRGYDVGTNLKATTSWNANGNGIDLFGFKALASGRRNNDGTFGWIGDNAYYWSSTAHRRIMQSDQPNVYRNQGNIGYGRSVRCIRDCYPMPGQAYAGPDSLNIGIDSIVLMANTPQYGQGLWTIISGIGGVIKDHANPNSAFYGISGMTYELEWTISNFCGSTSDTVMISFNAQSYNCGYPLVDNRDGKVYNTVMIGSQCWMAENLNIGTMINSEYNSEDNGTIEKYCYDNDPNNCDIYGGLYQWDEMMHYTNIPGIQGVCPFGWHVPTDDEWKVLEGSADSQYGVGNPVWNDMNLRGFDAGLNLKATSGWNAGGNGTDIFGFASLPAGFKRVENAFNHMGHFNYLFTSSEKNNTSQSLKIEGTTDALLKLGDKSTGKYTVKFYLYFPAGYGGYYNFQHFEAARYEFAFECLFEVDGTAQIFAAGGSESFVYDHDRWIQAKHIIDLDSDIAEFYLDGVLIDIWQYSIQPNGNPGTASLGAIDFFPYVSGGGTATYYVDDIDYFDGQTAPYWEDFESYPLGSLIAVQNPTWWTTWSGLPGSAEDAPVVDDYSKDGTYVWYRALSGYSDGIARLYKFKERGFALRCVADSAYQSEQANAGVDSLYIPGNSLQLDANIPVIGQGAWSVISGQGGSFDDPTDPKTVFHGLPGHLYFLEWTITINNNSVINPNQPEVVVPNSSSDTVMLYFASQGFVCGDPLVDTREWKSYQTQEIGTQCWMAENLNVGTRINAANSMNDNGVIEKYCYDDLAVNCDTYGGLYEWDEMMQYDQTPAAQGICPSGWHLPTDDEWKVLEGSVDGQYGIGDPEWDNVMAWRGSDAGNNLKSTFGWTLGGNGTDIFNLTVLPSGFRDFSGTFSDKGAGTMFWTSSESTSNIAYSRSFNYGFATIYRGFDPDIFGFSVRCVRACGF